MTIATGERMYASDINNLIFFPIGTILQFSGSEYTRLTNARTADNKVIWTLCNGTPVNGITVPNLVDKFLRGAASSGTTAGADSQSVTITSTNLPEHTHGVGTLSMSALSATELPVSGLSASGLSISGQTISGLSISGLSVDTSGAHTHSGTGTTNTGSGGHTHSVSGNTGEMSGDTYGEFSVASDRGMIRSNTGVCSGRAVKGTYYSDGSTDTQNGVSGNGVKINLSHTHDFSFSTSENGGTHAHDVNVNIPEGGSHSHTISGGTISSGTISGGTITGSITGGTVSGSIDAGAITGSTESAGSGSALTINTLPSYYTVVYIMKVA
ncbi:putative phage tail fiber protein [Candidatus Termititenax aidoneus]|uniref:Phage tail fiber protein n=1 Tax=Termititenax aidoneus TaxID=2218524 RepID=A0A388TAG4_TERA1|nr:putative phage tail fiber protein [Candidatus Termititenax aidoneus]